MTVVLGDLRRFVFGSWLNVLLVFFPLTFVVEALHAPPLWVFVVSALAIIPLAGRIGQATEATAEHTGPGVGGLLNATFGNATELIIALLAARQGLYAVVKASISGSFLGNMLLVLGLALMAGDLKLARLFIALPRGVGRGRNTMGQGAVRAGTNGMETLGRIPGRRWRANLLGCMGVGGVPSNGHWRTWRRKIQRPVNGACDGWG